VNQEVKRDSLIVGNIPQPFVVRFI